MAKLTRTCFVSYPWTDRASEIAIENIVRPVLRNLDWRLLDPRDVLPGDFIFDTIARQLRECALLITDLSRFNSNVLYELGMAHGWGKPTIVLTQRIENVPFDIASRYSVLAYTAHASTHGVARDRLEALIRRLEADPPSLFDPALERLVEPASLLAIELLAEGTPATKAMEYVSHVLSALDAVVRLEDADLREVRLGSVGAFVRAEAASIVSLVEKVLFYLPEWRLRNAERVRVEAEAELLLAQASRERAMANSIRRQADRDDAELVLKALEAARSNGPSRVTLGNRVVIQTDADGMTTIALPSSKKGIREGWKDERNRLTRPPSPAQRKVSLEEE